MKNKLLQITILSLSLLTVMAGAAVSPALGGISTYFNTVDTLYIKMILTVPGLFIIITNLVFDKISKKITVKEIAVTGLLLYLIGGCGAVFVNKIWILLSLRAVLGIGVGLIMPLSTGLIGVYFDKNEQSKFMGYSAAMNNLGGVVAMTLSGFLASLNWRYSFLVYLLGFIVLVMIITVFPNRQIQRNERNLSMSHLKTSKYYFLSMFITMIIFYDYTTNFSMINSKEGLIDLSMVGLIMSIQGLTSFLVGMYFEKIKGKLEQKIKIFAPVSLVIGYMILAITNQLIVIALALLFIGFGIGILVPLLNSQLSNAIPKNEVTSVMAIMSAIMYFGQFASPIITNWIGKTIAPGMVRFPYFFAVFLAVVLYTILIKTKIE